MLNDWIFVFLAFLRLVLFAAPVILIVILIKKFPTIVSKIKTSSKDESSMNSIKENFNKNKIVILGIAVILCIFIFSAVYNTRSNGPKNDQPTSMEVASTTPTPQQNATNLVDTPAPSKKPESNTATPDPTATPKPSKKLTKKQKVKKKKDKIREVIEDRIFEEYDQTRVDHVSINEDLGTKKDGDYIALVYLIWNVKNSGSMSKRMISMYSEDLAATVGKECSNVQEITIFWTVPYLDDASAKCSYERKSGGMYETDTMFDSNFN